MPGSVIADHIVDDYGLHFQLLYGLETLALRRFLDTIGDCEITLVTLVPGPYVLLFRI